MRALRSLLPYFRPYRSEVTAGLLFVVVASGLSSVLPWVIRSAVNVLTDGGPRGEVLRYAILLVGVAILAGFFRYWMRHFMNGVSRKVEYDIRNALFARLAGLNARYFGQTRTGDIMARLTNDLSAVRMAAGPAIMYLASTVFGGVFAIAFMLRISALLTGLALLPMLLLPLVMARLGSAIHRRFEAVQEQFSALTVHAQENISGVRVVRAYQQEGAELRRFGALNDEYLARNMQLVRLWGIMHPALALLSGLGGVVVIGLGGSLVVREVIGVGDFVAFTFYLAQLTWPLIALGWVVNLFQRGAASMARLNDIMDSRSTLPQSSTVRPLPAAAAGREIRFEGVWFHYPVTTGEPQWALSDVSFSVPPGGTLGIVGSTGSGKSALLDLIPRLHDPQRGAVLVDGIPVTELSLSELRGVIGYAAQDALLFSDTLLNNIRYGGSREEDAFAAAKVARLESDVATFPDGYNTVLGERGINLSGGQKQRATLARALARKPEILLLDDTLSAVDTLTESEILKGLHEGMRGRTVIVVAHRISAVQGMDHILVLDNGRIVERGTHAELLELNGRYAMLWRRQQLVDSLDEMIPLEQGTRDT